MERHWPAQSTSTPISIQSRSSSSATKGFPSLREETARAGVKGGAEIPGGEGLDRRGHERPDGHDVQDTEAVQVGERALEGTVLHSLTRAVGADDQQPGVSAMASDEADQVEGGPVGPLQVVEDKDEPVRRGDRGETGPYCLIQPQARLFGGQRINGRQRPQLQRELGEHGRQDRRERAELGLQQRAGCQASVLAKGLQQRQVGRHALGIGGAAAPHHHARLTGPPRRGVEQAGLANPRLARKEDDAELAALCLRELIGDQRNLAAPPERRRALILRRLLHSRPPHFLVPTPAEVCLVWVRHTTPSLYRCGRSARAGAGRAA